jgi:hypothetical protein
MADFEFGRYCRRSRERLLLGSYRLCEGQPSSKAPARDNESEVRWAAELLSSSETWPVPTFEQSFF